MYPTNLQPNNDSILVDCFWVIEAPANMTVVVKVAYQIPGESTLCKDFLQVNEKKLICIAHNKFVR